ncbi:D-arabinono-1,4-lactone oxidase [Alloalcanivorax mobilis]|uniref:D-arabinono-1,4-lactone oxidase n=1 Tax=Alloalcanivorax mobilis TaxID=2019569 RepID=UPI000C76DD9B|nr:D-arabinono-1,4-lactone oxidase [Alloalcanivorax mobilis]
MDIHNLIERRAFLKALGGTLAAAGLPAASLARADAAAPAWNNWSGNQQAHPRHIHYPANEAALIELLGQAEGPLRPFGGSHSFSPLVPTAGSLISLEAFNGVRHHDRQRHTIRYGAGTRIGQASAEAWRRGESFTNEPDINLQSLAGAIATSTHGTGLTLGSLSAQVRALTLISVDGEQRTLSAADGDLFDAARCNPGALGFVTDVTFVHQSAYRLEEHTWTLPLEDAFEFFARERDNHRNLEMFAFPLGGTAILKTMAITDNPEDLNLEADDNNDLLETVCELSRRAGWLTSTLQKLVTLFVSETRRRGPAHRIYANHRAVRFNEMEYTVPAERGLDCLKALCQRIRERELNVFFPIEFRYVAADDTLLSMFSGRAGASLSVHQYHKQDYRPLFQATEPLLREHGGRPHWGKIHSLGATELRALYPRFDDFLAIRRRLDPDGRLLNPHLQKLFNGVEASR